MRTPIETIVKQNLGEKAAKLFRFLLAQKAEKADVVVFPQGDKFDRTKKVIELYKKGFAKRVVIVGHSPLKEDVPLSSIKTCFIRHGIPSQKIKIIDGVTNSAIKALKIIQLARRMNYKRLLIVVSPYYLLRSYLTFLNQIQKQKWQGILIMQTTGFPWERTASGRGKTGRELLEIDTKKIKTYSKDVAMITEGLKYAKVDISNKYARMRNY
jgi:uncharacterized SAM-binding protein YcdF (DUF218 family)